MNNLISKLFKAFFLVFIVSIIAFLIVDASEQKAERSRNKHQSSNIEKTSIMKQKIEKLYIKAVYDDEAPNVFADKVIEIFNSSNDTSKIVQKKPVLPNKRKRYQHFKNNRVLRLKTYYEVEERDNFSFTITTEKYGIIDYYPKSDRLLFRKTGEWIDEGLNFIVWKI